jgi:hypothetical protein
MKEKIPAQCVAANSRAERCGSPAVRGSELCFFHNPAARHAHELKRLALRPDPTKLALRNLVRYWPTRPASRKQRALLRYAFGIAMGTLDEKQSSS